MGGFFMYKSKQIFMYLFLAFPLLDYMLRNYIQLPLLPSLWDEGVLVLLLLFVFYEMLNEKKETPKFFLPLSLFVVIGLAHLIIDLSHFFAGIEGFRAVYQYILTFFVGYYLIDEQKDALKILRYILFIGTIAAVVGVAQVLLGVQTPASWTDASEQGMVRAFSFVVSPNVLGSYMALMAPIALGLIIYEEKKYWKAIWIFSMIMIMGAFILSGSRGAWLAFFGAFAIVFMLTSVKLLITSITASAITVLLVPRIRSRILNLFSPEYLEKSASDGRIERWTNAFHIMQNDPFLGLGIGHYGGAVGARYFQTIYVDSYYFKTLAELGLIGFGLFAWLVITAIREMYVIWQKWKGSSEYYLLGGLLIGLIAVLLHNAVENIFEVPFMNSYFWFLIGYVFRFSYYKKGEE